MTAKHPQRNGPDLARTEKPARQKKPLRKSATTRRASAPAAADAHREIFLATQPGLEAALYDEVRAHRFRAAKAVAGGVTVNGTWADAWRANLLLRGASRVLMRVATFRAPHLSDLERSARAVPWRDILRPDVPVTVEATCRGSRIYHSGAASERVERAIHAALGKPASDTDGIVVRVRIENDECALSIDTSGELLHKRGFKEEIGKAPMRETLAALFLRRCGFTGTEPVVDPMCGSGTFVIEAAEMAAGLAPGRARHFAFEHLATFDAARWQAMRAAVPSTAPTARFYGRDRDAGAIRMSRANAERAGVADWTDFSELPIEELAAPAESPGLVIVNPPYGDRIGDKRHLATLYRTLGATLAGRFKGWRVGLVTSDRALAEATGLPFDPPDAPVPHGSLRITLYRTGPLG